MSDKTKTASTSALAREMGMPSRELFTILSDAGWIEKVGDHWELLDEGRAHGGWYKENKQYGKYIVWPVEVADDPLFGVSHESRVDEDLTSTALGDEFGLSGQKMNSILSELGWIEKRSTRGWWLTAHGEKNGGQQFEHYQSGVPYVCWPPSILENKSLQRSIQELKGYPPDCMAVDATQDESKKPGFREKFPAKFRATDGHLVRSKSEMLIDNWLYMAEIVHVYERKVPIDEEMYSDFYIPKGKIWIEFWGIQNNEDYERRRREKVATYEKYGLNLIELMDEDVNNIDDVLPRKLRKFGVESF